MIAGLPAALGSYARRLHARAGDGQHVVSPLGAWLVLALCGPLQDETGSEGLTDPLGMQRAEAFKAAEALIDDPHPLVALAAAVWSRPRVDTPLWRRWQSGLPDDVGRGGIPSPDGLDAWTREHTLGLIEAFPLELTPEVVAVLATAVACRVSWEKPLEVVDASQLGSRSSWASRLRRVLRAPAGDPRHRQYLCDTPNAGKGYPSERTTPGQEADLQGRSACGRSRLGGCPRLHGGTGGTFLDFELATSCR